MKTKRITRRMLFAKTVELLQPQMHLDDWKIVIRFFEKLRPNDAIAYCHPMPEYKQAGIRVSLTKLSELNHYEVISTAIHEMLHCITWSMTEWTELLCKKDKQKLEITRKLDESVITHLEHMLTTMTMPLIQKALKAEGYGELDSAFDPFKVMPIPRASAKKKS